MDFETITSINTIMLTFLILVWYFINNLEKQRESTINNSINLMLYQYSILLNILFKSKNKKVRINIQIKQHLNGRNLRNKGKDKIHNVKRQKK